MSLNKLYPLWSKSVWIYPGYPGNPYDSQFVADTIATISDYNSNNNTCKTCAFNMVYPYGTDLGLPWAATPDTVALNDPSNTGFFFDSKAPGILAAYSNVKVKGDPMNISPIIDGRLDNGYLQDLNSNMTTDDIKALAYTVVKGGTSLNTFQNGVAYYATTAGANGTNGIGGIQFDLEPVDLTNLNQIAFYTEVGRLLAETNQYYSIFTFPKNLTAAAATMLNTYNNGYAIISLYDLVDLASMPTNCTPYKTLPIPSGCDTGANKQLPIDSSGKVDSTIPHSITGYYNAAYLTAMQTIALAKANQISYKFAIPGGPSVHEFINAGNFNCTYPDVKRGEKYASCSPDTTTKLNLNTTGVATKQLQYVQQAILAITNAINDSITSSSYDSALFIGVDVYSFSKIAPWTASPILIDWDSGDYYTCYPGTTCNDVGNYTNISLQSSDTPYIYTATEEGDGTQGFPTQDILTYLQTCLDPRNPGTNCIKSS